jgi:hypothetical protein
MKLDFDRLPHYDVGGKKFLSTAQALLEATRTGSSYRFCLFEKSWQQFDWTQDPRESWTELLRRRCQQLREKYDWISLFYSSGRDSDLVLRSFIDNKIHLDEVVIQRNPQDPKKLYIIDEVVVPAARMRLAQSPLTKLTIINLGKRDYEQVFDKNWLDRPGAPGGYWTYHPLGWNTMIERHPELFPYLGSSKRRISILGADKPKLKIQDGAWYMYYQDAGLQLHMHDGNIEWFYFTPDLPELHAKQCWMAIQHAEKYHQDKSVDWLNRWSHTGQWGLGIQGFDDFSRAIGRGDAVHRITGFGDDKKSAGHEWYQAYIDQSAKTPDSTYRQWHGDLSDLGKTIPTFVRDDNIFKGTVGILGKHYFLKKYENHTTTPGI